MLYYPWQFLVAALCLGAPSVYAFPVAPTNQVLKETCRQSSGSLSQVLHSVLLVPQSTTTLDALQPTKVLEAIDELFPPQGLSQRMALSRKDGYWPFINVGDEPPQELVYGEFDTLFFSTILHRARELLLGSTTTTSAATESQLSCQHEDWVFCDLGSGTGRLVLTAAGLFPWKLCRGIELLEGIHEQAVEKYETCKQQIPIPSSEVIADGSASNHEEKVVTASTQSPPSGGYWEQYQRYSIKKLDDGLPIVSSKSENDNNSHSEQHTTFLESEEPPKHACYGLFHLNEFVPLSPIELNCGSFTDPYVFFGDSNVIFVYSSAMPYYILIDLARAIGRQCQPGTLIITTEYQLPRGGQIPPWEDDPSLPHGEYEIELIETLTGENDSTGGVSTAYIQRLTKSLGDGIRRSPPVLPVSEIAYRVIQKLERGELNNPKLFLRNVSNQMAFLGLPESWRPKIPADP